MIKYANSIPKSVSCRTGRIGDNHVQASFSNTIVTIIDIWGREISWSTIETCGFRGTRRGTPFVAQAATGNAIGAVTEQGMQRAEVMIKGDTTLRAIRRSGVLLSYILSETLQKTEE
ncbi:hypothetical protein Patl1_15032 [Pistacia atlantica]|uniref:Uncharacterized protein n=1 Tax=Pistacia atlantica TaxID=434234 RepID=A0ACC1B8K0_9ROSI|nr:hypothetical protein Patl1_15032 [Pistacia atlantica]